MFSAQPQKNEGKLTNSTDHDITTDNRYQIRYVFFLGPHDPNSEQSIDVVFISIFTCDFAQILKSLGLFLSLRCRLSYDHGKSAVMDKLLAAATRVLLSRAIVLLRVRVA